VCTSLIQRAIVNLFNISNELIELYCFVLESDIWSDNGKQYVQIRFHFPSTHVDIDYMNTVFIPYVLTEFTQENILHNLTVTPTNTIKDIIMPQTSSVIMNGCKTNQKDAPICFTKILN